VAYADVRAQTSLLVFGLLNRGSRPLPQEIPAYETSAEVGSSWERALCRSMATGFWKNGERIVRLVDDLYELVEDMDDEHRQSGPTMSGHNMDLCEPSLRAYMRDPWTTTTVDLRYAKAPSLQDWQGCEELDHDVHHMAANPPYFPSHTDSSIVGIEMAQLDMAGPMGESNEPAIVLVLVM
jgi:hypothetical protein